MDQFETNWLSMEFSAAAAEIETWNEGLRASFESIASQAQPDDAGGLGSVGAEDGDA